MLSTRGASHGARKCNTPRCFSLLYARRMRLVDKYARFSRAPHLFHLVGRTARGDCSPPSSVPSSRRLVNPRQCANYVRVTINSIFPGLWHSAFLLPSPYTVVNLRLRCDRFVLLAPLSLELADEHIVRFSCFCMRNLTWRPCNLLVATTHLIIT